MIECSLCFEIIVSDGNIRVLAFRTDQLPDNNSLTSTFRDIFVRFDEMFNNPF